jgi:formylglycine-generating enzyme required for sulfatase activity
MTHRFRLLLGLLALLPTCIVAAADKPESFAQTIAGTTVTFDMVAIPAGTLKDFKAAKDATPADVPVKSFFMAKTETRWDEYGIYYDARDIPDRAEAIRLIDTKVRPSKPYETPTFNFGDNGLPCLASTRAAAVNYCKWLSEKTGRTYRLPTSAEWEWACRGGGDGNFTPEQIKEMAWSQDNSKTDEFPDGKTHPVAQLKRNGYGLYDMLGNVCEWVLEPGQDPLDHPVAAGGSWQSKLSVLSPSYRQAQPSSWSTRDPQDPKSVWWLSDGKMVGFRVVCDSK